MAEPNPLGQEAEILTLARQRIRARFQCMEEEAAERLRRSIQDLFNEPDIPDQPPGPQQDPIPKPPGPPQPPLNHPDPQIEDNCQECSKNSALFAQFLLTSLTYVLLSYFVRLHCANIHTPLPFFPILMTFRT